MATAKVKTLVTFETRDGLVAREVIKMSTPYPRQWCRLCRLPDRNIDAERPEQSPHATYRTYDLVAFSLRNEWAKYRED